MKIYIAASYHRMHEMQDVDRRLCAAGHETTSQWVWGGEEQKKLEAARAEDGMRKAASMDWGDVYRCDTLLSFSAPREVPNGKSMHTEFGLAIAWGKRCVFIGPKGENIFHYLDGMVFFDNIEDFLAEYGA